MSLDMISPKPPPKEEKVLLKDLNTLLTCPLCSGYFIDAMTFDCMHTFCKSCILNHFETVKQQTCPSCDKKKASIKPDHVLQSLVYKMVPSLFGKETQRREDFYRSSIRASSTCSEDSVLGDLQKDQDKWSSQNSGQTYFSPEDPISLSLEFYQSHLDDTDTHESNRKLSAVYKRTVKVNGEVSSDAGKDAVKDSDSSDKCENVEKKEVNEVRMKAERRYLQCPAAVSMSHLQKFIRMKYALSSEHRVDIIYEGEVLPMAYTLMDVAYTFSWTKLKPMRFFYRIFTPLKVQPIKIINTSTSNGSKHLQIVPVRSTPTTPTTPIVSELAEAEKNKEQFVAQLKLQSKHKTQSPSLPVTTSLIGKTPDENCVFEYEEPDKEEIKRFAESRDREWARMRYEDSDRAITPSRSPKSQPQPTTPVPEVEITHHVKKRKKSKHSKGDVKKPKIHAEITTDVQQESIKLKVKLTPAHQHNGHKHKHRTPAVPVVPPAPSTSVQITPVVKPQTPPLVQPQTPAPVAEEKKLEPVRKLKDICVKKADLKPVEPPAKKEKPSVETKKPSVETKKPSVEIKKPEISKAVQPSSKEPKTTTTMKSLATQELKKKEEQKTFLKTFPSNANTRQQPVAKVPPPVKADAKKPMITYSNHTKQSLDKKIASLQQAQQQTLNKASPKPAIVNAPVAPAQKIEPPKEKKVSFALDKPHILNSQPYPMGFTVSKVEQGVKRKSEATHPVAEKRPCLEITLINPQQFAKPPSSPAPHRIGDAPKVKRPPPATIPLDRIKKSNIKKPEGLAPVSGALDLSKKVEPKNGITTLNGIGINGMKFPSSISCSPTTTPTSINSLTANLQLLSKVASQHSKPQQTTPSQTTTTTNQVGKPRPQIPNLQTLRIPTPTSLNSSPLPNQSPRPGQSATSRTANSTPQRSIPNLANLPKLNEITKTNLKMLSNHNNNIKPIVQRSNNHNMIRSIPNPAMLVRQHNQNRMSLTNGQSQAQQGDNKPTAPTTQAQTTQSTTHQSSNQPKILNPLAKENTSTSTTLAPKEKEASKESIHSLMSKIQNKGQIMVTASTTAAT